MRHEEHTTEAHDAVDNVTIRQLHSHLLPGLSDVVRRKPKQPAQEGDGHCLHNHPGEEQDGDSDEETQQRAQHQADAEGRQTERKRGQWWVLQQPQLVVHVGGQRSARRRAQSLSRVAPRGAPRIQREGHESQADVRHDDHERRELSRHVVAINLVQDGTEEGENQKAVQEAGDHFLR